MHRRPDGTLLYSPSDLTVWLEGEFAAWMERYAVERRHLSPELNATHQGLDPDPDDPELALRGRKGNEHEQRFLAQLRSEGREVIEIPRDGESQVRTLAAMRAGAPVIYQAHLANGTLQGYADFLVRVDTPSDLGTFHYEAWDTKLARAARPYYLVQLCAYAELLAEIQGQRPRELVFVLGDGKPERFRTDDYFYYYQHLKRDFLAFQQRWDPAVRPSPAYDRSFGRWNECAERILAEADHLSGVAGITRDQIACLEAAGIGTFTALATTKAAQVDGITPVAFRRLVRQAFQQQQSTGRARPTWEFQSPDPKQPRRGLALLPAPSRNDIFFDMEGYPYAEGGLEYLFGAVTVEGGKGVFHDWWAHDDATEKKAFEDFVDWAYARWEQDPAMHIYHYAAYEPSALRRLRDKYKIDANGRDALRALMGKHATRESKVDDMLRGELFVDLYPTIRQGLIVGTPSYSLKETEKLVADQRTSSVKTAGGSVVAYQAWIDSGEPTDWKQSPILSGIRDYNREDCINTWLLRDWLLERQAEAKLRYISSSEDEGAGNAKVKREPDEEEILAGMISLTLEQDSGGDAEYRRITQLLGHLLGYYRREERPVWWRYFNLTRHVDDEKRYLDPGCLAGLVRTDRAPWVVDRSMGYEFSFDPDQDTVIRLGSKVAFTHSESAKGEVIEFDPVRGLIGLKCGAKAGAPPQETSIVEFDFVLSKPIVAGIRRFAEGWMRRAPVGEALVELLHRRPPRIHGRKSGEPLIDESGEIVAQAYDVIAAMDRTTLAIQGPPGSGKTYTAARVIARLLQQGKRIAVTSTGHKVIMNLMCAVEKARKDFPFQAPMLKVLGDDEELPAGTSIKGLRESKQIALSLPNGPVLIGATAWGFCRPEVEGKFDYLFVDEAGQVALAMLVGIGACASNIVLMGDQMQLAQVTQGQHPAGVEVSALSYLLQDHATIPPELGIFLPLTWRMHPRVNRFISDAIYEGRLQAQEHNQRQRIAPCADPIHCENGIVVLPVVHEDNAQWSPQEIEQVRRVLDSLHSRQVTDRDNAERPLDRVTDLLFVAPYNRQVRALQESLGDGAKVGSVDRFQGQEAPVVVVSMCASSLDDAPRGAQFILSPNRLNVAISRAQTLAIVVASPRLIVSRCSSVEEMKLVNLFCRLVAYAGDEP
jgi:predicted RecB family nuclease